MHTPTCCSRLTQSLHLGLEGSTVPELGCGAACAGCLPRDRPSGGAVRFLPQQAGLRRLRVSSWAWVSALPLGSDSCPEDRCGTWVGCGGLTAGSPGISAWPLAEREFAWCARGPEERFCTYLQNGPGPSPMGFQKARWEEGGIPVPAC